MCRQWWRVCWIYGDQEKYYRQLYGAAKRHAAHAAPADEKAPKALAVTKQVTTTADAFTATTTTTTTTAALFAASLSSPRLQLQQHELRQLRHLHHLQRPQPE
ncbi:hypothetical protein ONE63_010969 [Megalurothrips usitatus]|uniref:Uncharacterized protein n=1 Tax=Megalurothrips usitatus TaxID=439358 RepID=A0AAV7XEM3_9NEOP|nr:hypothetical protein ONE63_010969 [Megalurothrips usitatus]